MTGKPTRKATASPCVGVCRLKEDDVICLGCGRTQEEIRDWRVFSDEQKLSIKRAAAGRLDYLARK